MKCFLAVVLSALLGLSSAVGSKFPPGFKFGAASAAYQVEGAWNVSDKGENVWDKYLHDNPAGTIDLQNGDVACDSYHLWREDVKMAADLGLHFYRFSISWSRLLPTGFSKHISEDGKRYYNDLIDALLENNIEPMVTLYHYDMPQNLQNLGGWLHPLISDWFADYAQTVYSLYGDRVKTWITVNEPNTVCAVSYNNGLFPPVTIELEHSEYICSKNIILAHAKAYRVYEKKFKSTYNGRISYANHLIWFEPHSEEDTELAELAHEYSTGRYSHPIFSKEGGWPPLLEQKIAEKSKSQGYTTSRLPKLTKEEIDLIKGTYDFYGFNYYISRMVRRARKEEKLTPFVMGNAIIDLDIKLEKQHPGWIQGESPFFVTYPEGLRKMLNWTKSHYGNLEFVITENGYCHKGYRLDDNRRVSYIKDHLEQVLNAIDDGINITAYTYWTLLDNFEWIDGYTTKFGLHEVDFNDPGRRRTPRKSASYYTSVIEKHSLEVPMEPTKWRMPKLQDTFIKKMSHNSGENTKLSWISLVLVILLTI